MWQSTARRVFELEPPRITLPRAQSFLKKTPGPHALPLQEEDIHRIIDIITRHRTVPIVDPLRPDTKFVE